MMDFTPYSIKSFKHLGTTHIDDGRSSVVSVEIVVSIEGDRPGELKCVSVTSFTRKKNIKTEIEVDKDSTYLEDNDMVLSDSNPNALYVFILREGFKLGNIYKVDHITSHSEKQIIQSAVAYSEGKRGVSSYNGEQNSCFEVKNFNLLNIGYIMETMRRPNSRDIDFFHQGLPKHHWVCKIINYGEIGVNHLRSLLSELDMKVRP